MDHPETQTVDIASAILPSEPVNTIARNDPNAPIRPADVAQVVTHTLQAMERLRVTGQETVQVALKLDSGHELTIDLRVVNGEITPFIRTESESLRLALEQNWSHFSQRGGDRDLRVTTPVFESPQTSSNMSDLNQQRDGRQRAYNEPAPDFLQPQTLRRNAHHNPPRPTAPTTAPAEGVRLYA